MSSNSDPSGTPPGKPWVLTIDEACAAAQVSRNRLYKEVHAGRLRVIKNGRRTLISAWAMRAWLESLEGGPLDTASVAAATAASVTKRFGVPA
jgi:excisionase family DNA binding protein